MSSPTTNSTAPVGSGGQEDQRDGHISAEVKVGIVTVIISVIGILLQLDDRKVLRRNSGLGRGPPREDSTPSLAPHSAVDLSTVPPATVTSVSSLSTATNSPVEVPSSLIEMDISDVDIDLDWKTQV